MYREVLSSALLLVIVVCHLLPVCDAAPLSHQRRDSHIITADTAPDTREHSVDDLFPSRRRRSVDVPSADERISANVETLADDTDGATAHHSRHRRSTAALFLSSFIHICDNNPRSALCSRVKEVEVSDYQGARAVIRLEQE